MRNKGQSSTQRKQEWLKQSILRKTLILIDGFSLFHMGEILGIGQFRMPQLYKLLAKDLTDSPGVLAYFVTQLYKDGHITSEIREAGFIPVMVRMRRLEDDDRFIIKEISNADVTQVSRIILVSTDGGYASCLEEKFKEGIHVTVIATMSADSMGQTPLSSKLRHPDFFV